VLTAELVLLSSCDQIEYAERNASEWFQDEAGKRACVEAGSLSGLKSARPQVVSHGHPERPSCNLQVYSMRNVQCTQVFDGCHAQKCLITCQYQSTQKQLFLTRKIIDLYFFQFNPTFTIVNGFVILIVD